MYKRNISLGKTEVLFFFQEINLFLKEEGAAT